MEKSHSPFVYNRPNLQQQFTKKVVGTVATQMFSTMIICYFMSGLMSIMNHKLMIFLNVVGFILSIISILCSLSR